jgi:Reverse transcriptase (RNA-dependent DNA polymerase)
LATGLGPGSLDLKSFVDGVPHDLVLKAVARHSDQRFVLRYVERWLKAPLQREDGSPVERDRGTPQGSAISPLPANVFLHYAFDLWMARSYPGVLFERYCDDVIVHARSEPDARRLRAAVARRLADCGLELNEHKTRIVYCKSSVRRGSYEHVAFDYLGYTFRPRLSRNRAGDVFVGSVPAVSDDARRQLGWEIRRWRLHLRSGDDPHRPGAIDQRDRAGMDQLLPARLPLRVGPAAQADQRIPRSLGPLEVQALRRSPAKPRRFLAAVYPVTRVRRSAAGLPQKQLCAGRDREPPGACSSSRAALAIGFARRPRSRGSISQRACCDALRVASASDQPGDCRLPLRLAKEQRGAVRPAGVPQIVSVVGSA